MLDNSYTINFGATPVDLVRVREQDFTSLYRGENGTDRISLDVKHTIPAIGQPNESHMVRLNVENYDASGVLLRMNSVWTVWKTFYGTQLSSELKEVSNSHDTFVTSTLVDQIIAGES